MAEAKVLVAVEKEEAELTAKALAVTVEEEGDSDIDMTGALITTPLFPRSSRRSQRAATATAGRLITSSTYCAHQRNKSTQK